MKIEDFESHDAVEDELITAREAADILHLDISRVQRLALAGEIPAYRFRGGKYRFKLSDIYALVKPSR